ncbi:uncharacterized protein [Temnothorax nylanderi]|uniref:uncharacterized protein n=2 Tax=Temnothorax nylanderi TaxID=102681 RepID=UPI003A8A3265
MSRFTIALFDDGLQLVPSSWLFDNKTMCHWPPYTNEKKIRKAIMEEASPDCTWTAHKILRVFGTSGTYASGIDKVKLAQEYSDLDISDIDISHQKRIPRQKKTSSTSDDSDQNNNSISENQQVTKEKSLPVPPSLPKSFIVNKPTKEKMQSEEFYPNSKKNIAKEASVTPGKGNDVLPEIFRRLNQIFEKLKSIDDRLSKLEENQNGTLKNNEMAVLQEFIALPLKTNEEVQNMEKDLENQDFFEQMAISLNRIGGRDSRELIINILKRTITNEIAVQYSWAGKLKKMGFKDLLLAKCIIRAVRITDDKVTEKDITHYISKWLVQGTLRHERSLEQRKTKHQKTADADDDAI